MYSLSWLCWLVSPVAMIPIAELAAYRDIPVFGWLSNEESLDDKNKLQTLVRSIAPLSAIGNTKPCSSWEHSNVTWEPFEKDFRFLQAHFWQDNVAFWIIIKHAISLRFILKQEASSASSCLAFSGFGWLWYPRRIPNVKRTPVRLFRKSRLHTGPRMDSFLLITTHAWNLTQLTPPLILCIPPSNMKAEVCSVLS